MAVATAPVTVTSTATLLVSISAAVDVDGEAVAIANNGSVTVYLGPPDVTAATGFPVAAGQALTIDLAGNESIYGITSSGTSDVRVLRAGA